MRIPAVRGVIDRRILANFRIDADVLARTLPRPFRPKIVQSGLGMGGICLIRLIDVRPSALPVPWGIRSENAAHRFAVEWDVDGRVREGVFIPRRDTDSRLNALAGGLVFPGVHHRAHFHVDESADSFRVTLVSHDEDTRVHVEGRIARALPETSVFASLGEASAFFERGSLGYSATPDRDRFDGLELACTNWHVEALDVTEVSSSYFEDLERFPKGSVEFDCGLLMRDIDHEWRGHDDLCCS